MPRSNFTISIPGSYMLYRGCGETHDLHPINLAGTDTAKYSTETVTGVARRKPQGWLSPTAYSLEAIRTDYATGRCIHRTVLTGVNAHNNGQDYRGLVGGRIGNGRFGGESHFNAALLEGTVRDEAGLRNMALIAVRNRLKSSHINLGVAFGERKQTAMLLGSNATRIANAVRHLKGGRIRRSMDELGISSRRRQPRGGNVPSKWLELQYGWKPLLSDVYGAAKALEQRPKGDWRVTAKVTKKRVDSYVAEKLPNSNTPDAHRCEARLTRSVFARIDALPQNEAIISLASLGVTNPLSIGWELVPYSFVVDWALPIGDWLESLDALLGYGQTSYSSSYLAKATWTDRGLSGSGASWRTINNFRGRKRMTVLSRTVSSSVPLPSLPRFKDPRSLGHMANGLALLATAFGRR